MKSHSAEDHEIIMTGGESDFTEAKSADLGKKKTMKKIKQEEVRQASNTITTKIDDVKGSSIKKPNLQYLQEQNKIRKGKQEERRKKQYNKIRIKQMKEANEEEDKIIKKLEKQLKLNKRKSKTVPKSFALDGLDCILLYLLEVCDEANRQNVVAAEQNLQDFGSDFEEDLAIVTGKPYSKAKQKSEEVISDEFSDDNSLQASEWDCSETEQGDGMEDNEKMGYVSDDEFSSDNMATRDDLGSDDASELDSNSDINTKESGDELWEDIYGRTRNKQGNIIHSRGKYVPPHLRAQEAETDTKKKEQLIRLRKQLKGLLNRLAENNMNSIAVQLEELYMLNSRNDMNETLTQLMVESLIAPVSTPERLVMEHVLLITVLHANVGTEVGAYFLQVMIKKFQEMYEECHEVENKLLDNIVLILAHLYNFKVFHCVLMFDVLDKLANKFEEKEVELILVVLRSVGLSLRKDDPAALKDLILRLQQQAATHTYMHNTRVKFMLDILLAIKNNNVSKIPNYDTSHSEHLKKLLKGFLRKGNYVTELKISLEDLLKGMQRRSHLAGELEGTGGRKRDMSGRVWDHFILTTILEMEDSKLLTMTPMYSLFMKVSDSQEAPFLVEASQVSELTFLGVGSMSTVASVSIEWASVSSVHETQVSAVCSEERGRWWVVGSAWTGILPGEVNAVTLDTTISDRTSSQPSALYSQQLMDLAKKQRMNTDVRRNIFCILMTAEDYLDAFEKLLHLGLKNQQEREIIHVLMHCCLQEKQFNPYYGVLAQKLCDYDRKFQVGPFFGVLAQKWCDYDRKFQVDPYYGVLTKNYVIMKGNYRAFLTRSVIFLHVQMTLQFSLWDRLKELSTMKLQQTSNLAKLLTHLLLEKGLPISVLKVVQFVDVDKPAVRFLRQVLLGVLLCSSEEVCVEVFQRTAQSAKLRMFRESLRLFIHHFLLRNTATLPPNDVQTLEKRAKIADRILSLQEAGDYL
uniref:MI domain-containing protein n=1 Tax=Timema monikensis TaxID=170555 RepID=A0A7R9HKI6_9NEOP|nr:unnamed protein product [Timema monikensis]